MDNIKQYHELDGSQVQEAFFADKKEEEEEEKEEREASESSNLGCWKREIS